MVFSNQSNNSTQLPTSNRRNAQPFLFDRTRLSLPPQVAISFSAFRVTLR